jgi:hypothetical protein
LKLDHIQIYSQELLGCTGLDADKMSRVKIKAKEKKTDFVQALQVMAGSWTENQYRV